MKAVNAATPVALVVLAVGTAAYAYFVDRGRVSDADRAARRTDVFPSFRIDQVRRIELIHGAETLVLERQASTAADGPRWTMTKPRPDATDPAAVDVLLRELEMATRARDVNAADAAGLDAPRVRGVIDVGSLEYRFALGGDAVSPAGGAYVRLDGEGTFVVERSLKVQLLRGADAYRDRVLVAYGASDVARLEIDTPGSAPVVLERRGTSFRVGGQDGLRAARSAMDHLFGALADARAESFVDEADVGRAMTQVVRTVVVTPRDPSRAAVTVVIGGACPSTDPELGDDVVVVRTAPVRAAACVARGVVEALATPSESLVDTSPFVAHADEIEELRIEPVAGSPSAPGPTVDLARRASGWHERAPDERELGAGDADSANALVEALAGARAIDVRRAEPALRLAARARVTLVRTGDATREVVDVGAPDATGVSLARRADDGAILSLPRSVERRFEPHPIALARTLVWRAEVDPGAVVALDDGCAHPPAQLALDGGTWKTRGVDADNRVAGDLVDGFARIRADAWIAESDDGSFGFGREGSCAVTLAVESAAGGPSQHLGIVFGAAGDGGVYAHAVGAPGVFVAPASLRALASRFVADRRAARDAAADATDRP